MHVLRWGQSAYETDEAPAAERAAAEGLGLSWSGSPDEDEVPRVEEADALVVTSRVRVSADVASRLRGDLVLTTTSGYDHIDVAACAARGVAVTRTADARRDAVVEASLAALVDLLRRTSVLHDRSARGVWARAELPALAPIGLAGASIAVIGLGVIGARMAEVLSACGARVLGVDPAGVPDGVEACDLDDALRRCTAVTVHCALTDRSRGLLSAERLALLSDDAVVVNTARGAILDVEAAVDAVRAGRLRGVAVDVFPTEPYPRLAAGAAVPGVRFTPHAAGYTHDLGARVARSVGATLGAWVAGRPLPFRVA